ncbi:MAG: 3-deoxy-8-phosphooctulonate synthase, partial [Bdellovibrionales bacterium]|nr:3-deoxy-8-phosphooctulonate synthase [Bdellovibrionales bacterium]
MLLIAGPCQIESESHAIEMAQALLESTKGLPLNLVYKSSFDKANRTSLSGQRGPGLDLGLQALAAVKQRYSLPLLTDIHTPEQAKAAAEVVDVLQTPAFLCRQTDLLIAVGQTGKAINCKKGQFLHPSDMRYAAEKISSSGNNKIMLCERGTCFGYRDLICDPRALVMLRDLGYPVIFDATHSVQVMGGQSGASGAQRQFVKPLIRSACAIGIDGLFIECHEDPDRAPSDGASMLPIKELRS